MKRKLILCDQENHEKCEMVKFYQDESLTKSKLLKHYENERVRLVIEALSNMTRSNLDLLKEKDPSLVKWIVDHYTKNGQ
jgi:hypothetical protein